MEPYTAVSSLPCTGLLPKGSTAVPPTPGRHQPLLWQLQSCPALWHCHPCAHRMGAPWASDTGGKQAEAEEGAEPQRKVLNLDTPRHAGLQLGIKLIPVAVPGCPALKQECSRSRRVLGHLPVQRKMSPGTAPYLTKTYPSSPQRSPPVSPSTSPGHSPSNLHFLLGLRCEAAAGVLLGPGLMRFGPGAALVPGEEQETQC